MEHRIINTRFNTTSFPAYRYEAGCTCGFATKMPNEEAAKSQIISHLQGRGVDVSDLLKVETKEVSTEAGTRLIPERSYHDLTFERFPPEQASDVTENVKTPEEINKEGKVENTTVPGHNEPKPTGEPSADQQQAPQNVDVVDSDQAQSSGLKKLG